jgi:hypothetical protein
MPHLAVLEPGAGGFCLENEQPRVIVGWKKDAGDL